MKTRIKVLISCLAFLVCALIVTALEFNPAGNINLKSRYNIINGGNISAQRIGLINAPSACPSSSYMTFYNGSVSTCTKFSDANINASTKNVTVQCIRFDSGGTICSS